MATIYQGCELECDGMKNVVLCKTMVRKRVFLQSYSPTVQEKTNANKSSSAVRSKSRTNDLMTILNQFFLVDKHIQGNQHSPIHEQMRPNVTFMSRCLLLNQKHIAATS